MLPPRSRRLAHLTARVFLPLILASAVPSAALICNWTGGDGNWNNAGMWDCGVVPDTDDTAVIAVGGTVTVTATASVASLSITTATLTGDADLTVTVSMTWSGGTLAGTGKIIIADTAVLSIVAGGASKKFLNRPIENLGEATVSSGPSTNGGGSLRNRSSGTLTFDTDLSWLAAVSNEGMMIKKSSAGNTFVEGGFTQDEAGSTDVQSGTLIIAGGGTVDGQITATGTSLWFQSGAFTFAGAEIDVDSLVTNSATVDFTGADSLTIGSFLQNGGSVTFNLRLVWINGDFTRTDVGSTFDAGISKVVFGGGTTQNLGVSRPTEFYFLEVSEGTRLIETVEADNASVSWFLWNRGVIEKTKPVPVSGTQTFGLTGVEIDVNDPGTFTFLQVERVGGNHPNSDATTKLGEHWLFTPTGGGFDVDLIVDHCYQPDGDLRLCRHTDSAWDCAVDSVTLTDISRLGVTQLTTWALGLTDPRTLQTGFECGKPSAWSFPVPSP